MRRKLFSVYYLLAIVLFSCSSPTSRSSLSNVFYVYRFDPPAFIEFTKDFQPINEIPFSVPLNCGLLNTFPSPIGEYILIELNCPNGQTILFLNTETASITQPVTDSDSHFLAWTSDGKAAYLKVDSLGNAHIARVDMDGKNDVVPLAQFTYDISISPEHDDFTFAFSHGLGQGSELWLAKRNGKVTQQLYADQLNYLSFARYSPTGTQIAFIKIPDTQMPFTIGELWVMNRDGSNARKVADADAGHGYAANWSPDGKRIAFVVRENPQDQGADQSSDSLISNVYVVDVKSGALTQITYLQEGRVETPFWSPDGNTLAFNMVINDRMEVRIADLITGEIRPLLTESTCCPAWIRK